MLEQTKLAEKAYKAAIKADPTIETPERTRKLQALDPQKFPKAPQSRAQFANDQFASSGIVKFPRVAKILDKSTRTVMTLCAEGLLQKAKLPNRTRYCGVTVESLNALIENASGTQSPKANGHDACSGTNGARGAR